MSDTREPDDDDTVAPPGDDDPGDAIASLRTGLARCRALVDEAHRAARVGRRESHDCLIVAPVETAAAAETTETIEATEADDEFEALQLRIEHAQRARAAAARSDELHGADPPVFADAPDVPRVPRGVAPEVWDVLRAALADGALVTLTLGSGAFRDPTPRTLTGRPTRIEFDGRGRPQVTLVVRPGVAPRMLVASIARVDVVTPA